MSTPEKRKATQIRFEGPDADSEPAGKVYTVRKSFAFAAALAGRMADERNLPLEIEAQPA